jgi:hypothetical protein
VDWGTLTPRLRPSDRVCTIHGRVRVEWAPIGIPVCTHCHRMMNTVTFGCDGTLKGFAEPAPERCAAPEQHSLVGGTVAVSRLPCVCPAALANQNGHRAWSCSACTELGRTDPTLRRPPHEVELQ